MGAILLPALLAVLFLPSHVLSTLSEFAVSCLQAHNYIRQKHYSTLPVGYSEVLEVQVQRYADTLVAEEDIDPSRPSLMNVRQDLLDIHFESWDIQISFPDSPMDHSKIRPSNISHSVHKMCCYSLPFCPSQKYLNLTFPPSINSVVNSWYENPEYSASVVPLRGSSGPVYSVAPHLNIIWKSVDKIACARSRVHSQSGCYFTVVWYEPGAVLSQDLSENTGPVVSTPLTDPGKKVAVAVALLLAMVMLGLLGWKRRNIRGHLRSFRFVQLYRKQTQKLTPQTERLPQARLLRRPSIEVLHQTLITTRSDQSPLIDVQYLPEDGSSRDETNRYEMVDLPEAWHLSQGVQGPYQSSVTAVSRVSSGDFALAANASAKRESTSLPQEGPPPPQASSEVIPPAPPSFLKPKYDR